MEKIKIENLTMTYRDNGKEYTALSGLNLSVEAGEFVCVIGSSGCGKSTLISIIDGLNKPDEGRVLIDGNEITGPGIDRAVVFQHHSLFPWLTSLGNVIFAMKQAKIKLSKKELEKTAEDYLVKVGLNDALDKYPSELSGGMQQRVAIARALAMNSDILLMDEPFGAIDPKTRTELQHLVSELSVTDKRTVLFVTHDIDEAILLADKILFIDGKKVSNEIKVDIPKPRTKEMMFSSSQYRELSNSLLKLFYGNISNKIGGEEVVI